MPLLGEVVGLMATRSLASSLNLRPPRNYRDEDEREAELVRLVACIVETYRTITVEVARNLFPRLVDGHIKKLAWRIKAAMVNTEGFDSGARGSALVRADGLCVN